MMTDISYYVGKLYDITYYSNCIISTIGILLVLWLKVYLINCFIAAAILSKLHSVTHNVNITQYNTQCEHYTV